MWFTEFFSKTIDSIHLIPGIYPHGVSLLTLIHFHVPTINCSSVVPNICMKRWFAVFLAATKQLYKWYFPSVRPSVCLSVRPSVTPFWLCSHHCIIMKFSGVITSDRSDVHAKGQGQRSKVKVTEVTTQLYGFRIVTPVWIHVWCILLDNA